ncbi:iron ABC transporter substrate-binding protein [Roseobacter cerasinus]|uniref:Iron ABC transporter substrate-binding protein n=1 Tax=Roseobacter cerasinus TaxID=2602289 RepID=A0A640VTZ7_9RHOB|nr:siderophore ABC transporter substrate-binding protein [Roseobacter cerasinus]GFE51064.1 iron ABC transporter substrate-binding protein [Roseobacter cerasinus]
MVFFRSVFIGVFASLGFATCAFADTLMLGTATGDVSVPLHPANIVALDVAAVDTLDALGAPLAAVPSPIYVAYLADVAASALPAGTLFEPDFEAIANLDPDLIVAGGRSSTQVGLLSDIAPTIDMTIWGDDHVAQALARLETYGRLTGREDRAAELAEDFKARLAATKAAVAGRGSALIVMTNGPKVSAYGAGSRFGWLHRALEWPEAVPGVDAQTHGEAISFEFIAEANPDWLIVIDRASAIGETSAAASATLDNALVARTTAWQAGQIIYLNSANIYIAGGGIQSMMETLDRVRAGFDGRS